MTIRFKQTSSDLDWNAIQMRKAETSMTAQATEGAAKMGTVPAPEALAG